MRAEKVGFIGAGNLAEAMIRGIITSGYVDPGQIVISDVNQKRLMHLHQTLGPTCAWSNADNAAQADIVFLAVKPAQVQAVAAEIRQALRPGQFVVSVAAGTSVQRIQEALGDAPRLCRIMPNLSTGVRKSTIGLYADPALGTEELGPVLSLLSQLGKVFRIEDESLMAVITALSGSAPAYYVMMADALVNYGVAQGLPPELATDMILGTMEGSAAWALGARVPLDELWRRVVTPGGTTEAGMSYYQERSFIEIFVEGLSRSVRRARELGDR
jgi:pyrroline-5-carboxylate reductase